MNDGPRSQLATIALARDAAASITPPSPIGIALAFGHGSPADRCACVLAYRADELGYTRLVGAAAATSTVAVMQLTALTGTTGNSGVLTFSAHSDGKIYVENRMSGPSRRLSLHLIGARL